MELVEQLKNDGIAKGLCQAWQDKLKPGVSMERLVKLFIRGIDFCVKNDFPTLDFMRNNFKGKCEPYGAYVDDVFASENIPDVVLNGECDAKLTYSGYTVSRVVIRHSSKANITIYGHSCVTIDVFDNGKLDLVTVGTRCKVIVYQYGNSIVNYGGTCAKIINKNKNSY